MEELGLVFLAVVMAVCVYMITENVWLAVSTFVAVLILDVIFA